ncbi:hypothetical protein CIB48_g8204 [Xylaria polymorpha]|nr:hypothetical protein CIB48_g8204 [Xylaria polymorpha]
MAANKSKPTGANRGIAIDFSAWDRKAWQGSRAVWLPRYLANPPRSQIKAHQHVEQNGHFPKLDAESPVVIRALHRDLGWKWEQIDSAVAAL